MLIWYSIAQLGLAVVVFLSTRIQERRIEELKDTIKSQSVQIWQMRQYLEETRDTTTRM